MDLLIERYQVDDTLRLREIIVSELNGEMRLRGLGLRGQQMDLMARLSVALSTENNDADEGRYNTNVKVEGMNFHLPHDNPGAKIFILI